MEILATRYKKHIYLELCLCIILLLFFILVPLSNKTVIVGICVSSIMVIALLYFALQPRTAIYRKDGVFYIKTLFKTIAVENVKYVSVAERERDYYGKWNLFIHLSAVHDINSIYVTYIHGGVEHSKRVSGIENSTVVEISINSLIK